MTQRTCALWVWEREGGGEVGEESSYNRFMGGGGLEQFTVQHSFRKIQYTAAGDMC